MTRSKLIIQIPCYNEADQIRTCIKGLPVTVSGFDVLEYLVVDDGSRDATVLLAREAGAHHVLALPHVGLAQAFSRGIEYAFLTLHADVLVNYDADQQYLAADIPVIIAPLLSDTADYVLGERPVWVMDQFSFLKKLLQKLGSAFVSRMSGLKIPDVTTGFRALNRTAGLKLSVWSQYTYTLETLIHAVEANVRVAALPIRVNPVVVRPSRLVRGTWSYCWTSVKTVLITTARYRPFSTFMVLSFIFFSVATLIGFRFLWYFLSGGTGKVQSLILCAILAAASFSFFLAGILGENISLNRRLLEQLRYDQRLASLPK